MQPPIAKKRQVVHPSRGMMAPCISKEMRLGETEQPRRQVTSYVGTWVSEYFSRISNSKIHGY
jgi:hypothetical protein